MANKGPLSQVSFDSLDFSAPGPVVLGMPEQLNDKDFKVNVTAPVLDSDGTPLTGINKISVGVALANEDGSSPFVDVESFGTVANQVLEFDVAEGAAPFDAILKVIASNRKHWVAAFAQDAGGNPVG